MPDGGGRLYLTRERAAQWLADRGLDTITAPLLAKWATYGKGPQYYRLGKLTYYTPEDLEAWLDAAMTRVDRGRKPPA